MPYEFAPMSSRERRIVHLALRDHADLHTESQGEGGRRCLVVYPKNYKPASKPAPRSLPYGILCRIAVPENRTATIFR